MSAFFSNSRIFYRIFSRLLFSLKVFLAFFHPPAILFNPLLNSILGTPLKTLREFLTTKAEILPVKHVLNNKTIINDKNHPKNRFVIFRYNGFLYSLLRYNHSFQMTTIIFFSIFLFSIHSINREQKLHFPEDISILEKKFPKIK